MSGSKTKKMPTLMYAVFVCVLTCVLTVTGVLWTMHIGDTGDCAQIAALYLDVIEQCERDYGDMLVDAGKPDEAPVGLLYAKTLDFDGDMTEELMMVYRGESMRYPLMTVYAVENNRAIKRFERETVVIEWVEQDGVVYLLFHTVKTENGKTVDVYYRFAYDGQEFISESIRSDEEHFEEILSKWRKGRVKTLLTNEQAATLKKLLEETKRILNEQSGKRQSVSTTTEALTTVTSLTSRTRHTTSRSSATSTARKTTTTNYTTQRPTTTTVWIPPTVTKATTTTTTPTEEQTAVGYSDVQIMNMVLAHYNTADVLNTGARYVAYEHEIMTSNNDVSIVLRYQMSDEEAQAILDAGGVPAANKLVDTVHVDRDTGAAYDTWSGYQLW